MGRVCKTELLPPLPKLEILVKLGFSFACLLSHALPQTGIWGNTVLSICPGWIAQRAAQLISVQAYALPTPTEILPAPQINTTTFLSRLHPAPRTPRTRTALAVPEERLARAFLKKHGRLKKKGQGVRNSDFFSFLWFRRLFWWGFCSSLVQY